MKHSKKKERKLTAACTGKVSVISGGTVCTQCPPGTQDQQNKLCSLCTNNTYSVAGLKCNPCSYGLYSPMGASVCYACPAWTFFNSKKGTCSVCTPGSYMVFSANIYYCQACPTGSFMTITGSVSSDDCKQCNAGTVSLSTGASVCSTCALGSSASTTSTCTQCGPGTFNGIVGKSLFYSKIIIIIIIIKQMPCRTTMSAMSSWYFFCISRLYFMCNMPTRFLSIPTNIQK